MRKYRKVMIFTAIGIAVALLCPPLTPAAILGCAVYFVFMAIAALGIATDTYQEV